MCQGGAYQKFSFPFNNKNNDKSYKNGIDQHYEAWKAVSTGQILMKKQITILRR